MKNPVVGLLQVAAVALLLVGTARAQTHAGQYEEADIAFGAQLYASRCIICHGENGDQMPGAALRSGQFRNATSDRELSTVISNGVAGTAMVGAAYTSSELTALVAYLRNMATFNAGDMIPGDAMRGQTLFNGKGECNSCHRVAGVGPLIGPDLSNISLLRTAALLQRNLLDPTAALLPVNRPVRAVTADGRVVTGRRLNEDTFNLQLIDEQGRLATVDKSTLREYSVGLQSAMPSYAETLSEQERADIVAYLLTLKGLTQ